MKTARFVDNDQDAEQALLFWLEFSFCIPRTGIQIALNADPKTDAPWMHNCQVAPLVAATDGVAMNFELACGKGACGIMSISFGHGSLA